MSTSTESLRHRSSVDMTYSSVGEGHGFEMMGPSSGGPFTVFFRLVSSDNSPGQHLHPLTPLNTPFTQSPVQSPAQGSSAGAPPPPGSVSYPLPSPSLGPSAMPIPSSNPGVYYTAAAPPPSFFHRASPVNGGLHFPQGDGSDPSFVKARAMSVELHHSPPFHYIPPHRSSFCLPMDAGSDLSLVSEEMLLSAMPDRYDD